MQARCSSGKMTLAVVASVVIALQAVASDAAITSVTTSSEVLVGAETFGFSTNASDVVVSTGANTFMVRFGFNHNSAGGSLVEQTLQGLGKYAAGFTVGSSGNYDLTVSVRRVGELRRAQTLLGDINCGADVAPLSGPSLTLNAVETGPALEQLALPGVSIPRGSGTTAIELPEGTVSQTVRLEARPKLDDVSLIFQMAASLIEDDVLGCELAARLGAQNGMTLLCDNCVYPGVFAPRDINQDGLFVTVTIEDLCGNGGSNAGEECDLGERNGPGSCCTTTCQLREQDEICRVPVGDCDQPDACTGASPECSADAKRPASHVCRAAAADGCDVAEQCSGADDACPPDLRRGDGFLCRPADAAALGCDFAEVCDGGVCQPDVKAPPGSTCQSDANPCTNERCDDNGQCAHIPVTPTGKICDDALFCNGEDRCNAAGVCGLHLNAPCSGTQTCDEVGNACLAEPPILVTNADDSGPGSLRFAMGTAFDQAGADSISFDPDFFSTPRRIRLTSPLPDINGDLSILGPGASLLSVDGANLDRVFKVGSGVIADLRGLTITGGNAGSAAGGGILNGGTLTITRCHITGNTAAFGGGISNELGALLNVDKSTISNNTATGNSTGGGIASSSEVMITNSTISGNRATGSGGDNGGGLRLGSATIENSTITNNFAVGPSRAGGLRISVGTVTLRNSIIAANTASTPDVSSTSGSLSSGGFNLIGNPGPIAVNGTNDQKGTPDEPLDSLLFPLANNGGETPTHALRVTSPALDQGSRFGAIADQRGATRRFDVASIAGPGDQSDIGAVEMQAAIVTNADDTGAGSLRQVIADAPANGDILFDPAFFSVPRTIALEREIGIAQNLTMNGPGANLLTLSGGNRNGVFRVPAGGLHVAISGATLSGGDAVNAGGAIVSGSNLALSRCAIVGSHAGSFGGAVHVSSGSVAAFTDCTFSGNSSGVRGGAVELFNASASFTNCTISGNTASFGGGGGISLIAGIGDQTLAITNSTIANNIGTAAGGIRLEAGAGGSVSLTLRSSIIANNTGPSVSESPGVGGTTTVTSLGFNLTSDDGGGYLTDDTDQTNTDPRLGALQYNGGPTQTHMPLLASPAIDQGNSAGVATDQRGRTRSFDAPDIPAIPGSDNSDIGAVEAHPVIVMNNANAGDGSLRQVIGNAPEGADVLFDPQFFAQPRNIVLDGDILVGTSLSIHGPDALLNVSGSSLGRVFNIASDAPVTISDMAILNGKSQFNGGAIASNSDLALTRCTVGNSETDAQGGGVFLHGAVGTFTDSLIGRNVASGRGGGIGLDAASATLTNCTVFGNTATRFGGGISLVTSSGNQTLVVINSTITENEGSDSAGIRVEALAAPLSAGATLRNSILAGNVGPNLRALAATDATATIKSLGYNLSDDDGAGLLDHPTDQIETNPLLGPLQDNGGPTLTHALLPGSPAIDKGASSGSSTDQRGFPRPLDDPAIDNAQDGDGADIGAFELSLPEPTPTQTVTPTSTTTPTGMAIPTATRTPTPTTGIGNPTPTRTPTPTTAGGSPTPTVTPTAPAPACTGDCNRNGAVSVDELIVGVGIALGRQPVGDCLALDRDAGGAVDIAELIAGVDNALNECPLSQP